MPDLLSSACSSCGHTARAVRCYASVLAASGDIVDLHHPIESLRMDESGETWGRVGFRGRFLICTSTPCRRCGGVYVRRSFDIPIDFGCLGTIAVGLASLGYSLAIDDGVAAIIRRTLAGILVGYMSLRLASRCVGYFAARLHHISVADIPCCDRPSRVVWPFYRLFRFRCPACGTASLRYRNEVAF